MNIDSLLATLTDDAVPTQVHYYTVAPQPPPPQWEPRLLLRQCYRVSNQADAVIGLESTHDFKSSVYLVSKTACITFGFEDLLSLRSSVVCTAIDCGALPVYVGTVLVESGGCSGGIAFCNYQLKQKSVWTGQPNESDVLRQTTSVVLDSSGWIALKKIMDCVESYYNLCVQCSPTVQYLVLRYSNYFATHYKARALMAASPSDPELIRHINAEVPTFLQEINDRRLPSDSSDYSWYEATPLRLSMTPWIDSEVRRYCTPNIVTNVTENLKYMDRW